MAEMILTENHHPTFLKHPIKAGSKVTVISNRGDTWIVQYQDITFSIKKEKLEDEGIEFI